MKLTTAQQRIVSFLARVGAARIDAYGSLCSTTDEHDCTNSAGATTALRLVAHGIVTGRDGLVMLTEYGVRHAVPMQAARAA